MCYIRSYYGNRVTLAVSDTSAHFDEDNGKRVLGHQSICWSSFSFKEAEFSNMQFIENCIPHMWQTVVLHHWASYVRDSLVGNTSLNLLTWKLISHWIVTFISMKIGSFWLKFKMLLCESFQGIRRIHFRRHLKITNSDIF